MKELICERVWIRTISQHNDLPPEARDAHKAAYRRLDSSGAGEALHWGRSHSPLLEQFLDLRDDAG